VRARKLLVVGQQFDLSLDLVREFEAAPVGTAPVILNANGLIVSAGVTGDGKFVLGGFNVADLPAGFGETSDLPGEIVLAGAGFDWQQLKVGYDLRVRHLKTWAVPIGTSTDSLLVGSKAQRWAIKNPAWANARGDNWGDTFFVNDLVFALRALGHHVVEDRLQNWNRPSRKFDDVELVIRGKSAYQPSGKAKSILWVISHPELVTVEEVRSYDLVFAASASWAAEMSSRAGRKVEVLYQATNPARFKPAAVSSKLKSQVLFVGRTRDVFRQVVEFAVRAKAKLSVYGGGWAEFIDSKYIKGDFLPNEQVPAAYASCELLLNDHWQDMREQGFVSNRLFDAAACGTRVLSDHIDGLDLLFSGLVQTYQSFDEFKKLVGDISAWPSDAQRKKIAAQVAREHSFAARAKVLSEAANA
ncbi:MAG: glycosyltransferase, partial [Micrococcales bacterium]